MAEIYKTFMAEAEKLDPEGFAKARAERSELEALRKDAERYRWLRSQRDLGPHGTKGLPWVVWVRPDKSIPTLGPLVSEDCDAAIDAALRSNAEFTDPL